MNPPSSTNPARAGAWSPGRGEADDDAADARIAAALDAAVSAHAPAVAEATRRFRAAMGGLLAALEALAVLDGCVREGGTGVGCAQRARAMHARALTHDSRPLDARATQSQA